MRGTQTYEWYKPFKDGRTSIEDDPRSGRASTSQIWSCRKCSCSHLSNRRLTVREVANEVGIAKTTCYEILTEKLGMHCFPTTFLPRSTEWRAKTEVSWSQSRHFWPCKRRRKLNLKKKIITGDEMGFRLHNGCQKRHPDSKKARQVRSNVKVIVTIVIVKVFAMNFTSWLVCQHRVLSGSDETSARGSENKKARFMDAEKMDSPWQGSRIP